MHHYHCAPLDIAAHGGTVCASQAPTPNRTSGKAGAEGEVLMFRHRKGETHAQAAERMHAAAQGGERADLPPVMSPWARRALGLDNNGTPNLPADAHGAAAYRATRGQDR